MTNELTMRSAWSESFLPNGDADANSIAFSRFSPTIFGRQQQRAGKIRGVRAHVLSFSFFLFAPRRSRSLVDSIAKNCQSAVSKSERRESDRKEGKRRGKKAKKKMTPWSRNKGERKDDGRKRTRARGEGGIDGIHS